MELRPFQREVLDAFEVYPHLLCIAPTGSGKSLIFQTLARKPCVRMVLFSPLVALNRQHAQRLQALQIPTWTQSARPPSGFSGVWILSPESIQHTCARDWRPTHLIVDECHCLWEWGRQFRPAFRAVFDWVARVRPQHTLWLTATLSPTARADLSQSLAAAGLGRLQVRGGFGLPAKLEIHVRRLPFYQRRSELEHGRAHSRKRLVFVRSRALAESMTRGWNGPAWAYHAGLSREERAALEKHFSTVDQGVLFATSAYGMGMDVPTIDSVIFHTPPFSMTELAQGLGRCARGIDARGLSEVWFDDFDLIHLRRTLPESETEAVARFLVQTATCRRRALGLYFEPHGEPHAGIDPPGIGPKESRTRCCDVCFPARAQD